MAKKEAIDQAPADSPIQIKYVSLEKLQFLDGNSKRHDLGLIAQSIDRNGFRNPPIWDGNLNKGKGGIVAGNGRTEALLQMKTIGREPPKGIAVDESGEWFVPVVFGCDAESEAAAKAYSLDDNNLTVAGSDFTALDMSRLYEPEGYLEMLLELNQQNELPLTVDGDDLDLLLQQLNGKGSFGGEPQEENEEEVADLIDRAEKGEIESRFKLGNVIRLGRHVVACGDSTDEANIRKLLSFVGDRTPDMVWADPPFNTGIQQGRTASNWGIIENDKMSNQDFAAFAKRMFQAIASVCNPETHIYVCCHWKSYPVFFQAKPNLNALIVWVKNNFGLGVGYRPQHELIMFWGKLDSSTESNVWEIAKDRSSDYKHPMQKPLELTERAIKNSSEPGSLIFDPFLGSAPSLLSAQKMNDGRIVAGFELSPAYMEVIARRYESFVGNETAEIVGTL